MILSFFLEKIQRLKQQQPNHSRSNSQTNSQDIAPGTSGSAASNENHSQVDIDNVEDELPKPKRVMRQSILDHFISPPPQLRVSNIPR